MVFIVLSLSGFGINEIYRRISRIPSSRSEKVGIHLQSCILSQTSAKPSAPHALVAFCPCPPCFLTSSSMPFLGCSSQEAHPPKGRWILGTWSLASVSSPGRQINLVNSYSHYLCSLSCHLLFSVFQHFL